MKTHPLPQLAKIMGLSMGLSLLGVTQAAQANCKITLSQTPPLLNYQDLGPTGPSYGDILAFEASLGYQGKTVGKLKGLLTTVDLPEPTGQGREQFEERFGTLLFRFSDLDTLIATGSTLYPAVGGEMDPNLPQARAIIGGTGRHKFSRGQVTTTKQGDGAYQHVIELAGSKSQCTSMSRAR
jgi:hypothetical protein